MKTTSVERAIKRARGKAFFQKLLGWPIALLFGLATFVDIFEPRTTIFDLLILLALTALGVWLIYLGIRKTKLIRLLPSYTERLRADPEGSIDRIAASAGVSVKAAEKNIRDMLALGFLPNCFLDRQTNRLVCNAPLGGTASDRASGEPVRIVTVKCRSCGAENKIPAGGSGVCEYCGSPLSE